ncbi:hypothetical protein BS78_01G344200 [Paspalum vaginatum]|nr:hypothetical protein BS78_01G344200 [Paspalum vaginatum]
MAAASRSSRLVGACMDSTSTSTTAEHHEAARKGKRARLMAPSSSPSEDNHAVDLFSSLDDDLLLHILGLLADANDVVRTGALSRRWRGLWTRIPTLRFASPPERRDASRAEQCAALERAWTSPAPAWSLSATRRPSSMAPWIGSGSTGGTPRPPPLNSLTDLSLERISILARDVHLLGRLVSTDSCPCLQKLRMVELAFFPKSPDEVIDREEVNVAILAGNVNDVMLLELRTPCLRVLHIDRCNPKMLRVSAPKLEDLALSFQLTLHGCSPRCVEVQGDLPFVQNLKICLWSHYPRNYRCQGEAVNDASKRLIELCNSIKCLDVTLHGRKVSEDQEVEILKSRIPHLPHVTSLTVNVSAPVERHDFGASVATLLTRFSNLRRLNIHLPSPLMDLISMSHLQEVEFAGLIGTECELWLMKAMLASANRLHKVAISFNPEFCQNEDKVDAFQRMLLYEGMWTSHRGPFKLTSLK